MSISYQIYPLKYPVSVLACNLSDAETEKDNESQVEHCGKRFSLASTPAANRHKPADEL